ncbi:MAG: hypothetical protein U0Z44_01180 [Kouleothrix sp.]
MVRAEFPQVQLIISQHNGGYAYANNLALREVLSSDQRNTDAAASGADRAISTHHAPPGYVLLLNPDTVVPAGALPDVLVAFMEAHPAAGACAPVAAGRTARSARHAGDRSRRRARSCIARWACRSCSRIASALAGHNMTYLSPDAQTEVDLVVGACIPCAPAWCARFLACSTKPILCMAKISTGLP